MRNAVSALYIENSSAADIARNWNELVFILKEVLREKRNRNYPEINGSYLSDS